MRFKNSFKINGRELSPRSPTYFIADLAANHDGDLGRAKALIWQAKEAGADCVKFQHFLAKKIVSDRGFRDLGGQASHQSSWKKSVYQVFEKYEVNREWNKLLAEEAKAASVDFMTTPYDVDAVNEIDSLVPAYKIGSGDITWTDFLRLVASRNKPVFLASGASSLDEVKRAVTAVGEINSELCLMQCNTNYTGSLENFHYVNLNVLRTFAGLFPDLLLGLSDHTPGHATVLGAIALGARAVEKHFTDDNNREGPDHPFSMNPASWREMVLRGRELEAALGDGIKRVEGNEEQTVVLQRRCLRAAKDLTGNLLLGSEDLEVLRPAPKGALEPHEKWLGKRLLIDKKAGEAIYAADLQ